MKKQTLLVVSFISLLLLTFLLAETNHPVVYSLTENFTVPTRTPTALPPPPPTQPPGGGGGGTNPTAVPSRVATQSPATPTVVNFAPTPEGGFVPTASACSTNPTILAPAATNVREGPGTDYDEIGQLVFLEVRPIIGRAADARWWQITMVDGTVGWVFDDIMRTQGNLSVVPIVESPPINGVAPTPGTPWLPQLPPTCTLLPTWTAVPTQSATNTPMPTPTVPAPTSAPTQLPQASIETESDEPIEPVPLVIEAEPTAITVVQSEPIPTALPLNDPTSNTLASSRLFLIFGSGALLLGLGVLIFRRQSAE